MLVATADVHARIRAYGSLAAEVADAGVPGVVAMRYNVYVVTAAQYVADLYAHLLSGQVPGPGRHRGPPCPRRRSRPPDRHQPRSTLQDWAVPVVYEAAPLTLLRPGAAGRAADQAHPSDESAARMPRRRGAAAAGCGILRPR